MNDTWWVAKDELDDDQRKIIELPLEGSHLVVGPPGSGKTNLLLLRANYMYLAGQKNLLIVVFTRTLREFIVAGSRQYDFPSEKIVTCHTWATQLLREYGVRIALPEDFSDRRRVLIDEVQRLITVRKLSNIYDAVLLDESQDYLPEEIHALGKLGKSLYAVADPRQKIYDGDDPIESLRSYVDDEHLLRFHYRNGLKICELADALGKDSDEYVPMVSTSNYDEKSRPSTVEVTGDGDLDGHIELMKQRLVLQMKTYPGELLGVVCPRKQEVDRVWKSINGSELEGVCVLERGGHHAPLSRDTFVMVGTLHSVKGLEFRALHMAGCEFFSKFANQRNMVYTGVTRAKTALSVYCGGNLPGYFEGALAKIEPQPELPTIDDAFGRK